MYWTLPSLIAFRQCAIVGNYPGGPTEKLRRLCQVHGPDNEILSQQLKEIRCADSIVDFKRLVSRVKKPAAKLKQLDKSDQKLGLPNLLLRPDSHTLCCPSITTGYDSDPLLLAVIQSSSTAAALVQRGRRWWPNGMSCEEFRDIRRVLFTSSSNCLHNRLVPLRAASKFVTTSTGCQSPEYKSSKGKNQQENKHHYAQVGNRNVNHKSRSNDNTGDGASDNDDDFAVEEHLNKGFQWRVNILLKLCIAARKHTLQQ